MITSFKTEGLKAGFDFDIALEKDKPIYCFIGKNGIGKTQLLENMAKGLIFSHSIFKTDKETQPYRYKKMFSIYNIYENFKKTDLELPLEFSINKELIKNTKAIVGSSWSIIEFGDIYKWQHSRFVCDKPIVFIGAKNRGFTKNVDTNNVKLLSDAQNRFVESFERTLKYLNGGGLEQEEIA
ncbi:MAG: hypothetical protein WAX77_12050, partial [Methylococcaceae bacterium]